MKSVMQHKFSQVPQVKLPRSVFDRTHGHKTSFDSDWLIPFFVDEALPGDTFRLSASIFARLATPIHPIMDNLYLDTFYFAVPNRLVWSNWEKFNGASDVAGPQTGSYLVPTTTAPGGGFTEGSIYDYMGIPVKVASLEVNTLHLRAYQLIWNEWFRDQNLQNAIAVSTGDGPDTYSDFGLLKRNKRHDYFTSCLPWPQKGDSVEIGMADTAPVYGTGNALNLWDNEGANQLFGLTRDNSALDASQDLYNVAVGSGTVGGGRPFDEKAIGLPTKGVGVSGAEVDLSAATAVTINELRQAFQIQRMLEKDARGGTRYTEILRTHFGVVSPDFRLQRPEYLGGSSAKINISPVAQTSSTDATTPQGNLSAFGTVGDTGKGFTKSFTEHCVIIGLVNVRSDITYQQGINKMWSRQTRYDFYWPSFAHLGEQEVLQREIFADGTANDDLVFGYQERFAEYRYKPSIISGRFRTSATATLDSWHLSEVFASRPYLNAAFIQSNTGVPLDRAIAVPSEPHFIFDSFIQLRCARPMPVYSVPGLIDHF